MILHHLIIDTIDVVAAIPSGDFYAGVWSQLHGLAEDSKELFPGWTVHKEKAKYSLGIGFAPEKGRQVAMLQAMSTKSGHRIFKLRLQPSKFKGKELVQFVERQNALLPGLEYEKLMHTGRVSRVDFAVDSGSHPLGKIIPLRVGTRYSAKPYGADGTVYLGSKFSPTSFCIYDKKKHLSDVYAQVTDWQMLTRFEARLRKLQLTPAGLIGLPNPYQKLFVAHLGSASLIDATDSAWQAFLSLCVSEGSAEALRNVEPKLRPLYRQRLISVSTPIVTTAGWKEQLPKALAPLFFNA